MSNDRKKPRYITFSFWDELEPFNLNRDLHIDRCLYFILRAYMDKETKTVGEKYGITRAKIISDLQEEAKKKSNKKPERVTIGRFKAAISRLEEMGLVITKSIVTKDDKMFICELPKAPTHNSTQNMNDQSTTDPEQPFRHIDFTGLEGVRTADPKRGMNDRSHKVINKNYYYTTSDLVQKYDLVGCSSSQNTHGYSNFNGCSYFVFNNGVGRSCDENTHDKKIFYGCSSDKQEEKPKEPEKPKYQGFHKIYGTNKTWREFFSDLNFDLTMLTTKKSIAMYPALSAAEATEEDAFRGIDRAHLKLGGTIPSSPAYYCNYILEEVRSRKQEEEENANKAKREAHFSSGNLPRIYDSTRNQGNGVSTRGSKKKSNHTRILEELERDILGAGRDDIF
jgi:hypothetical protein